MYIYTILSKRAGACNARTESEARFDRAGRKQIPVYSRDAAVLASARARASPRCVCTCIRACVCMRVWCTRKLVFSRVCTAVYTIPLPLGVRMCVRM